VSRIPQAEYNPAPSSIAEVKADRRSESAFLDLEATALGEIDQLATIDFRDPPPKPFIGIPHRVLREAEILETTPRDYQRASAT
jgi:hypothetical protein